MRAVNTMYSRSRAIAPREEQGITIAEIEDAVRALTPGLGDSFTRPLNLLFAILKVGCSIPKLEEFTGYSHEFLFRSVEGLRERGLLFTGSLSTQWVLDRVPGCEDLVGRITEQRFNTRKEFPKMATLNSEAVYQNEPVKTEKRKTRRGPYVKKKKAAGNGNGAAPTATKVSFSIVYIDDKTHFEKKGDSLPKFLAAMNLLNEAIKPGE